MNCESCGVVLAKTTESQNNVKCSQFSMLKKAYFELGHQHMDCTPTLKKKDSFKVDSKKSSINSGNMTIDDLYDRTQKKPSVKNDASEDKSVSKNSNKEIPTLMRRKSSQLFIALKTMNFLNANKKSNPDSVHKK